MTTEPNRHGVSEHRRRVSATIEEAAGRDRTVLAGSQIPDAKVFERLDLETGTWLKNHLSKPPRFLVHVGERKGSVAISMPDPERRIGSGNLKSGQQEKICFVFRVFALARGKDGMFTRLDEWEWLVFFILKRAVPRTTTSATLRAPSLADARLDVDGPTTFRLGGLISLCAQDEAVRLPHFEKPLTYAEVTEGLVSFLETDSPETTGHDKDQRVTTDE